MILLKGYKTREVIIVSIARTESRSPRNVLGYEAYELRYPYIRGGKRPSSLLAVGKYE